MPWNRLGSAQSIHPTTARIASSPSLRALLCSYKSSTTPSFMFSHIICTLYLSLGQHATKSTSCNTVSVGDRVEGDVCTSPSLFPEFPRDSHPVSAFGPVTGRQSAASFGSALLPVACLQVSKDTQICCCLGLCYPVCLCARPTGTSSYLHCEGFMVVWVQLSSGRACMFYFYLHYSDVNV